jgi:excisionase family DNA binding protein
MSNVPSPSDLLTREQAAQYLGLKPQTLSVWACTKRYGLPYLKVGSLARYRRSDLDAWLQSRTVNGDPADSRC